MSTSNNLHIYIDETGNTGLNHFDKDQPYFILGAVISDRNLDVALEDQFSQIRENLKIDEVHASKLGIKKINQIAALLCQLIQENDLTFHFCIVEKEYYMRLALFHLIFDPGINPAVSNAHFLPGPSRITLAFNFVYIMDESVSREFWDCAQSNNVAQFVELLKKVLNILDSSALDVRSKELLGDALAYTIENPEEILNSMQFKNSISPNVSAFSSLFNTFQHMFDAEKFNIESVVHDEQSQFGASIRKAFETISQIKVPTGFEANIMDSTPSELFKRVILQLRPSKNSLGIQLTDIILWIFKRTLKEEQTLLDRALVYEVLKRTVFSGNTLKMHFDNVQKIRNVMFTQTMSKDDYDKAKRMIRDVEEVRWKRKK